MLGIQRKIKMTQENQLTFLLLHHVKKEFAWRNKPNQNIHNNLTYDTLGKYISDRQLANKTESFEDAQFIPVLAAGCGTKIHNPQVAQ